MEVIINTCYGGFGLSDAAIERCLELGMTCTELNDEGHAANPEADFALLNNQMFTKKYNIHNEIKVRTSPVAISVVREMGEKAGDSLSSPKIVEIPFDSIEGWYIQDYDGKETVVKTTGHGGNLCP